LTLFKNNNKLSYEKNGKKKKKKLKRQKKKLKPFIQAIEKNGDDGFPKTLKKRKKYGLFFH